MKITGCEDVGIKKLQDLSKEELVECLEYVAERNRSDKFWIDRKLLYIADKRRKKKLEEDEAKGNKWINLQREYEELLRPYKGKTIGELPAEIIEKGAKLERAIRKAQEEYFATFDRG